ncbi:MAG: hypothetical protein WC623_22300 [Pedobacter sp.]|uniref:hypothetical protein n=1 Tax=Pedobacter sp. TaxID=1411316 RepID=UPI003562304E
MKINKKDFEKAEELVSDAEEMADDAFRILKKYMTEDERLIHNGGTDIAGELRSAILTLAGVSTELMEMADGK